MSTPVPSPRTASSSNHRALGGTWHGPTSGLNCPQPRSWNPTRWGLAIGLALGLEIFGLVRWTHWPGADAPPPSTSVQLELPESTVSANLWNDELRNADPTFLAIPGQDAFSRAAERGIPLTEYALNEYPDAPVWLPHESTIQIPRMVAPAVPRIPMEPIQITGEQSPPHLLPNHSWAESRQPGRKLVMPIAPSTWTSSEVLRPTVVGVSVNEQGEVLSARIIESNGLAVADEEALALSRLARFEPLDTANLSLGDHGTITSWEWLTFHWLVRPPTP